MYAAQPRGKGRGRGRGNEPTSDCSGPKLATRTSTESRLPVARCRSATGTLGAVKLRQDPRGSRRHGRAYVEANPHPRAARFGQRRLRLTWIGCNQSHGSAAACSRLQQAPSATGSWTGGIRLQHSARGCNTLCCAAAASHLRCAEADIPEGSSGDTDVGGDRLGRGADVGGGMDSVPV